MTVQAIERRLKVEQIKKLFTHKDFNYKLIKSNLNIDYESSTFVFLKTFPTKIDGIIIYPEIRINILVGLNLNFKFEMKPVLSNHFKDVELSDNFNCYEFKSLVNIKSNLRPILEKINKQVKRIIIKNADIIKNNYFYNRIERETNLSRRSKGLNYYVKSKVDKQITAYKIIKSFLSKKDSVFSEIPYKEEKTFVIILINKVYHGDLKINGIRIKQGELLDIIKTSNNKVRSEGYKNYQQILKWFTVIDVETFNNWGKSIEIIDSLTGE